VNVKAERVPVEMTWFDRSTDYVVNYLKKNKILPHHFYMGFGSLFGLIVVYFLIKWCYKRHKQAKRFRDSKDYFKFD
jgi:hypothetical protein